MKRNPIAIAVALILTVAACDSTGSGPTAQEQTTPTAKDLSGPTKPTWILLGDQPENVPLKAGAYGLTPNGAPLGKAAVVQAPTGYLNYGGWTFVSAGGAFRGLGFYTVDRVYADPCGSKAHSKYDSLVDPGTTVKDLANALVAQKRTKTTKPVPVTIDGYQGVHLNYRLAKGLDIKDCEDHVFDVMTTVSGSWYLEESGERAGIWILDVDGDRAVLSWAAAPGTTRPQIRQLTEMVESTKFVNLT